MSKKVLLTDLNKKLNAKDPTPKDPKTPKASKSKGGIEANPARGNRGNFLKATITLSPEIYEGLQALSTKRKLQGMKDTDISALLREAAATLIKNEA